MKKLLLTLAGILAVAPAFAQALTGSWTGSMDMDNVVTDAEISEAASAWTFTAASYTAEMRVVMDLTDASEGKDEAMTITVTGTHTGAWTRKGDVLSFTPEKGSKMKLDVQTEGIPSLLAKMFTGPVTKELTRRLREKAQYRILSQTATTLLLEEVLSARELKSGRIPARYTLEKK